MTCCSDCEYMMICNEIKTNCEDCEECLKEDVEE